MTELRKATLTEIDNDNKPKSGKKPIPVQFNPAALRMQFSNQSEGGQQPGKQARQYTGTGSTTLSLELLFDTADEGTTQEPRSVLERTAEIEQFMKPQGAGGKNEPPPRLRFQWGNLIVDGVMESLSLDLDHFAHDGTPLRAKMSLTIKGQNPEYQFNQAGPGAKDDMGPTPAAASAAQPGIFNNPLSDALNGAMNALSQALQEVNSALGDNVTFALGGESLAGLAQRMGLDPAAWRGLAQGLANPLNLKAGAEIRLGGAAGLSLGFGVRAGVNAGTDGSMAARLGLAADGGRGPSPLAAQLRRGYAVAAAGGVGAALETVKAEAAASAVRAARQAFVGAAGGPGAAIDPISTAAGTAGSRNRVFSMRADSRADTFGRGVPLRDRVQVGHDERANRLAGQSAVRTRTGSDGLPPTTADPATPPWQALPARSSPTPAAHGPGCRCRRCRPGGG